MVLQGTGSADEPTEAATVGAQPDPVPAVSPEAPAKGLGTLSDGYERREAEAQAQAAAQEAAVQAQVAAASATSVPTTPATTAPPATAAPMTAAPTPAAPPPPPPTPAVSNGSVWDDLASCEAGGNWSINTGNGYYGGLQFSYSTWHAYGGGEFADYPHQASREAQIVVGERVVASAGGSYSAWPSCRASLGLP